MTVKRSMFSRILDNESIPLKMINLNLKINSLSDYFIYRSCAKYIPEKNVNRYSGIFYGFKLSKRFYAKKRIKEEIIILC